jgi:LmbE family N-acetylglucosaminyl deacetylase/2-polyprenyl-3-methyl-5-hydroxy-6-metoxy-1,4-benzoquinol methylase
VVSFNAQSAAATPQEWFSDPRWPLVPALDTDSLRALDSLMVFAAHPDDETLGVGGLLARCAELSIPTRIVVATGDEPRLDELRNALEELGVNARIDFLGFPDGSLKKHADRLASDLADIVHDVDGTCWLVAPWPGDRHGDHRTLGRELARIPHRPGTSTFFYPVWLWQWGTPDECPWDRALEISLSDPIRRKKNNALDQYASQIQSAGNPGGVLTNDFLAHARTGHEIVIAPATREQQPPSAVLAAHFEKIHSEHDDPWSVRTRWYERRKRAVTMATLPREHFSRALEIGCSIGEVSADLIERCDRLVAIDGSEAAVATARRRLGDDKAATVQHMRVPYDWPSGDYDLIVVSEVAYYLADDEWRETIRRCRKSLSPDGVIVLCHWLGAADDFAQSGERAHQTFRSESALAATVVHRDAEFLLEVFENRDGSSDG